MINLVDDFQKHPSEQYTKVVDYSGRLPTGATVTSATVFESINLATGDAAASIVGSPEPAAGGLGVAIPVQGGVDGQDYLISINLTLSNNNVLNAQLVMRVMSRKVCS